MKQRGILNSLLGTEIDISVLLTPLHSDEYLMNQSFGDAPLASTTSIAHHSMTPIHWQQQQCPYNEVRNTALAQRLYKARAALGPQLLHMPAFARAGQRSHTIYSSAQTSVDATQPLRKALLTNLTRPHAVATSPGDPGHVTYDRIRTAQGAVHSCHTALSV